MHIESKEEQENLYKDIIAIYDIAKNIVDKIEAHKDDPLMRTKLSLIEPIIEQVEETTEILAEEYLNFIENGQKVTAQQKNDIERTMRRFFNVVIVDTKSRIEGLISDKG